ncbi:tetratricopeptide repeat protein [Micromonospora sp. NPDC048930]|uniref:tetratricopeptide repeat protein n=1 Tax=Micromonospora sp. NPDC048930 TaxID=3364261 RepID=UPI00371E485B
MTSHAASDAGVARAGALLEVGRIEAARREIADVLAGDPDNVEALYVLARAYEAEDEFAAMRDAAARAVAVAPGQHEGHLLLAFALIGVEDPTAARASALETVRLAPEDWRGYAALALASLNLGQPRHAFRTIKRAVGLAPESAGPHYIRALMFHSIGWDLFANRSYRRALALDPEHTAALTGLGHIAATRGRLAAAAGHVSAVLAAEPANHAARAELDRVVIGGFGGWAMMSVWTAGFIGMFAMLPWVWLLVLLPPALWSLWAARAWRALTPGARAYAEHVVRTDIRARVRLFGLALCALSGAGLFITALRQDPDRPPSATMVVMMVAHFVALIVSGAAVFTVDRKVAGPPPPAPGSSYGRGTSPADASSAGVRPAGASGLAAAAFAQPPASDLLAEQREASYAGRWAMRLVRAGALFAVVPILLSVDPPASWPSRAIVGTVALAGFLGYGAWSRRRLILRPGRQNAALGMLLVPLTLAALAELVAIVLAAALPSSAMPLPEIVAVPAVLATGAGLVAWLGWLLYAGARGLARLARSSRQGSSHHR